MVVAMMISLHAQMRYGDAPALISFFGDHAFSHAIYARYAATNAGQGMPLFDIADQRALFEWIAVMEAARDGKQAPASEGLEAWLQAHNALHMAELAAMGINATPFDLSTVDFSKPSAFDDWMQTHAQVHATQDQKVV